MKKILVACEHSGTVKKAFTDKGYSVVSCDYLPCDIDNSTHKQTDVTTLLNEPWDLIIAHPDCTYIANSGVRHLHSDIGRWFALFDACDFFKKLLNAKCKYKCVENPIPHKYAIKIIGQNYTQCIQPWQFGHGEVKATCLWLHGLPKLKPTKIVPERNDSCHKRSPGPNRSYWRSITYQGIADAMAEQWGKLL